MSAGVVAGGAGGGAALVWKVLGRVQASYLRRGRTSDSGSHVYLVTPRVGFHSTQILPWSLWSATPGRISVWVRQTSLIRTSRRPSYSLSLLGPRGGPSALRGAG